MIIIDNLKQLFTKENRLYLIIVIWLLVGIFIINFLKIIGIFIFIPYLAFLMFLYLLSLVSKKDIRKFSPLTLIGLLIISIPIMIIIIVILFVLFAFSLISYIFLTSWFILYGLLLSAKKADDTLKTKKGGFILRGIIFFGGITLSITLLVLFFYAPTLDVYHIVFEKEFPIYLNYAYLIIGIAILFLSGICIISFFRKSFNGWYGLFSVLIAGYAFYLVLKIFLGITGLETTSDSDIITQIGLLIADLFIILYAISTLLGSKAELLAKQLKYFGIDSIFIWLLFSKASYEFVENFPFEIFSTSFAVNVSGTSYSLLPFLDLISFLDNDVINIVKNVAVLIFFILLIVFIGLWEIRKYNRTVFERIKEEKTQLPDLISTDQEITAKSDDDKSDSHEKIIVDENIQDEPDNLT